jgi:hypothetical protein
VKTGRTIQEEVHEQALLGHSDKLWRSQKMLSDKGLCHAKNDILGYVGTWEPAVPLLIQTKGKQYVL